MEQLTTKSNGVRRKPRGEASRRNHALRELSLVAIVPALFAVGGGLAAQETTGRLRGRAVSEAGAALAGVNVGLTGVGLQAERVLWTDERGDFRALALPPGVYRVHVKMLGFRDVVIERVVVRLGQTASLGDIVLRRAEVVLDPVIVRHDAEAIDAVSTTVGSTIDARTVENLPTGRDYLSLLMLLPQVTPSYRQDGFGVAGATGFENAYYVDGINVTDPYRADGAIDLPYNFIDHVELKVGGYEAEFGRALGGIVNAVTRTGSNRFISSVFGFYSGSSLATTMARGPLELTTGRYTRYDVGASAGGPLIRDRLWYYAAYDLGAALEDVRMPGLGVEQDRMYTHHFAAKLSWRADSRTDVTATVIGDPSRHSVVGHPFFGILPIATLGNPDPYLARLDEDGLGLAVSARRVVGSRVLLEGSLARTHVRHRTGPRTTRGATEALFVDFATGTWSGGHGNMWDRTNTRNGAAMSATFHAGPHSLKAGVQYEANRLDENWQWRADGPGGAAWIFGATGVGFQAGILDFRTTVYNRIPTLFAQGSYLAHPRIRLNAGVRWEGQYLRGVTSGLRGAIDDQVQPRLGFVVYPTGTESQKITASLGRFYEQLANNPVSFSWGGKHQEFLSFDHDPRADPTGGIRSWHDARAADDLEGQHFDEVTLGYERALPRGMKFALRGVHRQLKQIIQAVRISDTLELAGNPGRGSLSFLPEPRARYDALELWVSRIDDGNLDLALSYVLSRKYGNYSGLLDLDSGNPNPNATFGFNDTLGLVNSVGLLPNDRTHVLKAWGSYRFGFGLSAGALAILQSGTPLSELGAHPANPFEFVFLRPRGTAGRTPWLWDAGVRLTYDVAKRTPVAGGTRIVADAFHVFSRRKPVLIEQKRFLGVDAGTGEQIGPNPLYRRPLRFQPPMTLRLGVERSF